MIPSVSVIIPVYGVESFVERCVRSLMEQTLQHGVEFIFVNDATIDRSFDIITKIIKDYPNRQTQIKLLHHDKNKGLPAARNTGLSSATGEYIYHFDADDFAEKDILERYSQKAIETGADYIWADWFLNYEHTNRLMKQASYSTPQQTLRGLLTGEIKYNVWNKLVKRSLYTENGILFPEGHNMGEDMTMIRLASCASSVAYLDYAGYHYVKTNTNAMTTTMSEQSLEDLRYNVGETIAFIKAAYVTNLPSQASDFLRLSSAFCLHTKFPLLISPSVSYYKRWAELWPDSNQYIRDAGFSGRNRALNIFASKGWWPLVKAHYYIYSILYQLFYK